MLTSVDSVHGRGIRLQGMDCTNCFAVTGTGELFTWGGGGHHPAAGLDVQVMERKFGGDWYSKPRRVDGGLHRAPDAEEKWAARMIEASAASAGVGGDGQPQANNASQPATTDAPSSGTQGGVSEETALQLSSNVVDVSPGTEHCVASIREGKVMAGSRSGSAVTGRARCSAHTNTVCRQHRCARWVQAAASRGDRTSTNRQGGSALAKRHRLSHGCEHFTQPLRAVLSGPRCCHAPWGCSTHVCST